MTFQPPQQQTIDSCRDCYAWGATRTWSWRCKGCATWRQEYPYVHPCAICATTAHLNRNGYCRLCRKQATMMRQDKKPLDVPGANKYGQQLFFADMFGQKAIRHDHPRVGVAPIPPPRPGQYPVGYLQLPLFAMERSLGVAPLTALPPIRDEVLTQWIEGHAVDFARQHGWSRSNTRKVLYGLRRVLALQETPGALITTTEITVIKKGHYSAVGVQAVLADLGMLDDDREPAIQRWFTRQITGLPEPMREELHTWFRIMFHGSTSAPRRRPRSTSTISVISTWVLPSLHRWAADGHQSLREINREHVREHIADSAHPAFLGQGLRNLFGVLKQRKLIFANPTARLRTGQAVGPIPVPAQPETLRAVLNSDDTVQAAMTALSAFHGLSSGQLRALLLTDIDGGKLHVDGRTIPLAQPVVDRIRAWLDTRQLRWPHTANPHLFITGRTATTTQPASIRWAFLKAGQGLSPQAIRTDRILDEALATGGDARRIADMFGLSVTAASRYANAIGHPDLR